MTSASGASFANGTDDANGGVSEVIMILAVDVGERCRVNGWACCAWVDGNTVKEGFGSARI